MEGNELCKPGRDRGIGEACDATLTKQRSSLLVCKERHGIDRERAHHARYEAAPQRLHATGSVHSSRTIEHATILAFVSRRRIGHQVALDDVDWIDRQPEQHAAEPTGGQHGPVSVGVVGRHVVAHDLVSGSSSRGSVTAP